MTVALPSMPRLPAMYARAVGQAVRLRRRQPGDGGDETSAWTSEPVLVQRVGMAEAALAAYRQMCGFGGGAGAPATYPQVLAFPLQLLVMTSPAFPFPAMGAVHIANTLEQHGPLAAGDALDLTVYATDPRAHRRGRQVSVVTQASVGGRAVWRARADYLHVEHRTARGDATSASAGTEPRSGQGGLGWRLPADLGRRYAAVSGDRNPIHLYDATAWPFGYRRHIAPGMWTLARCLAQLEPELPARIRCEVGFRRPIPLPGEVVFRAERLAPGRVDFSVEAAPGPSPGVHVAGSVVGL
jgi:acyl dehydratase